MNPNLMTPQRLDLPLVTNADRIVMTQWLDPETGEPIPIASAAMTLRFDQLPKTFDADGNVIPPAPPVYFAIDDIDETGFGDGIVRATVRSAIWAELDGRTGEWDLVAVSTDSLRACLLRGEFVCEEGITIP